MSNRPRRSIRKGKAKAKEPKMCSICEYMRTEEVKLRPGTDYMEKLQKQINPRMRGVLIDWLVDVAQEYKLVAGTLYQTVSYIDRFLSKNIVTRKRFQLLGAACMSVAAKREEMYPPQAEDFCYTTDNSYVREEFVEMEQQVLTKLDAELATPTIKSFLRRFVQASQGGTVQLQLELKFLADYMAELTLLEYKFLGYLPSMVAASALFLARLTLYGDADVWPSSLQHYTGYRASELKDCVKGIYNLHCISRNCSLPAIKEKYSTNKFNFVANFLPVAEVPAHCFEEES